jgi:uncharacterized membrane protein YdjX (TVP38/TMEM64 family)
MNTQNNSNLTANGKAFWSYVKAFLMLGLIALGWLALSFSGFADHASDYGWMKRKISEYGLYGPFIFIGFFGISTVIGVPRLLVSAIAGFSFDFIPAILIALTSTMLGCVVSFFYARYMGRSIIREMMSMRIRNLEKLLVEHDFTAGIAVRALPISNNTIVNLLAGVTGVRPWRYFAGSAIGYLPLTIVFVLAGSGVQQDTFSRILLSLGLYLFLVIPTGYFVQKRLRAVAGTSEESDGKEDEMGIDETEPGNSNED